MKTILVPTDFSKVSKNAIDYAVELAKRTKAKLVLFHVYYLPIVTTDVMVMPSVVQIEKDATESLKKRIAALRKKHGNKIVIQGEYKYGSVVDEILNFTKKHKVDMIVMGMNGAGLLTEKLIGSSTTSVMRKVKCPVLTINGSVKFKVPKKIILACDFRSVPGAPVLKPLKEIVKLFKSTLLVLNVMNEFETVPAKGEEVISTKLKNALSDTKHSFHFIKNNNVSDGINKFGLKQKANMVVMMPHKHTVYETLFFEHDTKRMAFHTKLPLLTLNK